MKKYTGYKICVNIKGPCNIRRIERPETITKFITMTNPIMGWFQLTHTYNYDTVTTKNNLEIMLSNKYPRLVLIIYDYTFRLPSTKFDNHKFECSI